MFLTGYIAGLHFVQALANPRPLVSVGRMDDGELDVVDHESVEEAYDHCAVMLYAYAVVVHVEGDVFHFEVMRPDMPDDLLGSIEMHVVSVGGSVLTSTPIVDGDDFDAETFFDGFVAGLEAEEHIYKVSFGALDVMPSGARTHVVREIQ